MGKGNAFTWDTYEIPRPEGAGVESFKIRHHIAGRTGATKTWAAAPALLNYLVLNDGLRNIDAKNIDDDSVLDISMINPGCHNNSSTAMPNKPCNVLELGGGSGFLSVGLAKAFRSSMMSSPQAQQDVNIICTDMDRNTIKNMRHNICENKETKSVAVENLEWGDDIGGEKFSKAMKKNFKAVTNNATDTTAEATATATLSHHSHPVQLLTHVIAADVHYGETTLGPLSSIISSIKVVNPRVQVIIMLKERSPNAVAELVEQIEIKMKVQQDDNNHEQSFPVHVRDVMQSGVPELRMKLIEC